MPANLLPAFACLSFVLALIVIALLVPRLRSLPQRIRESDARAVRNQRIRRNEELKWRELERRAEFRAGMHRKMTGGV